MTGAMCVNTLTLFDKASEAAVLGSMIQNHRVIPAVLEWVRCESFFLEGHRIIFDGVLKVWRRNPGGALDGVLLRSELASLNQIEGIGGLDYLREVVESTPTPANAVYYAQRVAEKERYRRLVAAYDELGKILADGGAVDEQVQRFQASAMSLESRATGKSVYDVRSCATQVALDTQERSMAIPTGFRGIDRLIAGVSPGDLVVVAARPSQGKTALACGITLNMAKTNKHVLLFTLEMSARSVMERLIAMMAEVSLAAIKTRNAPKDILAKFYQASLDLEKLPITIVENATTPERQAGVIQSMQQSGRVDLVMVDYLGLMDSGMRSSNRNEEVTAVSKSLKHTAQRHGAPVIALSQLNRACEGRENHRPRLSDLRDSGSIEQDADVVMFIHREDYYRKLRDPETTDLDGLAEIVVAKQRNGPTGVAKLVFMEEQIRFVDYSNWME